MKHSIEELKNAQKEPKKIRNISIIAHADHGKSALADSFIAYDGGINPAEAGVKIKLHEHEDEKISKITIDSKVYTLIYGKK